MDCAVFSPCGRFFVKFTSDAERIVITVYPKEEQSQRVLAAALDKAAVEQISTDAGVKKEFPNFANMIYNALIGKSPSVKFSIENCEEMQQRIRTKKSLSGRGILSPPPPPAHNDSSVDSAHSHSSSETSLNDAERNFFHHQRFFTLDYEVDFTWAIFPIPLNSVEQSKCGSSPKCDSDSRHHSSDEVTKLKQQLKAALDETKRVRRENEALTFLSNQKMAELHRICEDLQKKSVSEMEHRRLRHELTEANNRVIQLEKVNEKLKREVAAAARQSASRPSPPRAGGVPTRPLTPIRSEGSVSNQKRNRFDTPTRERDGASVGPKGRTGGRNVSPSHSRSSTPPRSPRPAAAKLGISFESSSSRERQRSSPSTFERLYRSDTHSSSNARRTLDPNRALFL